MLFLPGGGHSVDFETSLLEHDFFLWRRCNGGCRGADAYHDNGQSRDPKNTR